MKPTIISGIQSTGDLHIGNYLGAVRNWVNLQNSGEYNCIFFIADYHSLTGERTSDERRELITRTAVELIAAGIDPEKSTFFVQSHVHAHTELAWVFNSITPFAELERMTQFKDKSEDQIKNVNTGLFTYPVLQAADILLYQPESVPVGQDQVQHIELTRSVARWFNNKYGEYFVETNAMLTDIPKVKSLLEPTKKMSKSKGQGHVINLSDAPEEIEKKIKKAVTATEGGEDNPGVQNLLTLLKEFGADEAFDRFSSMENDGTIRYGDLKNELSTVLADHFADFRTRRTELLAHPEVIAEILIKGAEKANVIASKTMEEVRKLVGVR